MISALGGGSILDESPHCCLRMARVLSPQSELRSSARTQRVRSWLVSCRFNTSSTVCPVRFTALSRDPRRKSSPHDFELRVIGIHELVGRARKHERRPAGRPAEIDVGPAVEQPFHQFCIGVGRDHQRCQAPKPKPQIDRYPCVECVLKRSGVGCSPGCRRQSLVNEPDSHCSRVVCFDRLADRLRVATLGGLKETIQEPVQSLGPHS